MCPEMREGRWECEGARARDGVEEPGRDEQVVAERDVEVGRHLVPAARARRVRRDRARAGSCSIVVVTACHRSWQSLSGRSLVLPLEHCAEGPISRETACVT